MNTGDIYVWATRKAKGHDERTKYHVFICESDWRDGNIFLFISSINYGGDFEIAGYDFLPNDASFVSCTAIVDYSDDELENDYQPELVGRLRDEDLSNLFDAVAASELLEGRHIRRVCQTLAKFK